MKKIGTIFTFLIFMTLTQLFGQNIQIRGTVTDASDNSVLPAATIVIKGTNTVAITLIDGTYSISAPSNATLVFSFIGMESQEIAVAGRQVINVALRSSVQALGEVVIVGYSAQSQRSLAASVTTLKTEGIKDVPSPSLDQMLQGRAAGVNITNPNAGVGQPPVVIIRGVGTISSGTQPLYVLDGMPMISGDIASMGNTNALSAINPTDIESMTILKDAAATAIYGSRAANGVILITTKKGKQGALRISYDMNVGISVPTKFYKVMNAKEYVDFKTMAFQNAGLTSQVHLWDLNHNPWTGSGDYIDTNWADVIYKTGNVQNHTISISGATDKSDYYFSLNRSDQGGIVIGDVFDHTSVRANGSVTPMKFIKIGISTNYSFDHTGYVDASRNNGTFAVSGFPRQATILPPNIPVRNIDGTPYYEQGNAIGGGPNDFNVTYFNPLAVYEQGNGIQTWVSRMIANTYAEVTVIDGLKLKSQFGIDYSMTEDKRQWSPDHGDGFSYGGLANAYLYKRMQWTWTNTASYSTTFGDHSLSALVGMETSRRTNNYWDAEGSGVLDPSFIGIETGYKEYSAGGSLSERTLISYLANVNYTFRNRYILSGNFRRDGYSPLGKTSHWGNFYGVAAAWRVSEENFLKGVDAINDLKLKVSYGTVGNTEIGYYPSQSYYGSGYYGGTGTLVMSTIGDSGLRWESLSTLNAGFELTFLERFTVMADWYQKKTIDLILGVAQAPSAGISGNRLQTNVGQLFNMGVELTLSADVIRKKDFVWSSTLNVAFNKNEVTKLPETLTHQAEATGGITNITVEGKSIGQLYVYPTGGIDPATGRRIFYGSQGEKVYYSHTPSPAWRLEDGTPFGGSLAQVICGNTLPTYNGGWTNTFSYKGVELNMFFQFTGGHHIWNGMKASASDMRFWNNAKEVLTKHWTENNRNATYAKPFWGDNVSNGSAYNMSDYIEKGDYLRFKNISLAYNFNTKSWFGNSAFKISTLRIYAQAQNLFVLTKYSGQDPETITNVGAPIVNGGIDKNTLPQARTYTFGLNISF